MRKPYRLRPLAGDLIVLVGRFELGLISHYQDYPGGYTQVDSRVTLFKRKKSETKPQFQHRLAMSLVNEFLITSKLCYSRTKQVPQ